MGALGGPKEAIGEKVALLWRARLRKLREFDTRRI
jgi:hypothetical protein